MADTTPGLVCGHHHLYSALARGMPAPPHTPTDFLSILQQIWWRLDTALDLDTIYWSAKLGAVEALMCGTTAIVDHHESPHVIDGSLSVIAEACAEVGVRVACAYGVTDRWNDDGTAYREAWPPPAMTSAARRGLAECERFVREGGRGLVGVHASFTCSDATVEAAAGLASDLGVGVHVHVAEGPDDAAAGARWEPYATDDWLLAHCVLLDRDLPGTILHNSRSNMNNSVGYARPATRPNRTILGTDGIGADMLEEFRVAYARLREDDLRAVPDTVWSWLEGGWNYDHADSPWHVAFTPGIRALDVTVDGELLLRDGNPTRVDLAETRAKAAEAATRLFSLL
jgi:cytosine/adenosine deaminase-related metal-dependent hydrolase